MVKDMQKVPIYTTEPMVTRALAAEIRHKPLMFVDLIRERAGLRELVGQPLVRCEGVELIDIELTFEAQGKSLLVGIEAKLDHALTRAQIDRQLSSFDTVVILLPDQSDAPQWARESERLSIVTWAEVLSCFAESRLTADDVSSIPLQKRRIERQLEQLSLVSEPLDGWYVGNERNGAGLPAILMTSPPLPDGRELRSQLQVVGRSMPFDLVDVRFEYFLGISIASEEVDFPDPETATGTPAWILSLQSLRDEVIDGREVELLINTNRPSAGRSEYGRRKLKLISKHAPESTWLAKGYRDWALGVKSSKVGVDQLDKLSEVLAALSARWFHVETERQQLAAVSS